MTQKGDAAAGVLGTIASASAAIPVAGPFVAAGLGLASVFTKLFAGQGPRKRKRRRAQARREMQQHNQQLRSQLGQAPGAGGFLNTGSQMPMQQGQAPTTNQIPPQGYFYGGNQ